MELHSNLRVAGSNPVVLKLQSVAQPGRAVNKTFHQNFVAVFRFSNNFRRMPEELHWKQASESSLQRSNPAVPINLTERGETVDAPDSAKAECRFSNPCRRISNLCHKTIFNFQLLISLANAVREYMDTIGSNPIFAPKLFYGQRVCGKVESNDSAFEKILDKTCRQILMMKWEC